jgi:transposase InsO family protein
MTIDGQRLNVLIDTGCSVTLIGESFVRQGVCPDVRDCVTLDGIDGNRFRTKGSVVLKSVECDGFRFGPVKAHVCQKLPAGVNAVLGLDTLGPVGLHLERCEGGLQVSFGSDRVAAVASTEAQVTMSDDDFDIRFCRGKWEVGWKWKREPMRVNVSAQPNLVADGDRQQFDTEIKRWVDEEILVPHDVTVHGPVRNFLPLIAVTQVKGEATKVRPVCDFRRLNDYIQSRPRGATPVCAERLREWRMKAGNCALVDLKQAYLQVFMDPSLWCYQAIRWRGQTYLLTRLGFGLACAPKILTAIVEHTLASNEAVKSAVSSYIDDLYIECDVASSDRVVECLKRWGLDTKPPERLGQGEEVRVLGLRVGADLNWSRDSSIPDVSNILTRREVSGVIGKLLGHYPVCGWLRVACGFIQRSAAQSCSGWDDEVDPDVLALLKHIVRRLEREDPVCGRWKVNPNSPINLWVDASSLALGALVEIDEDVVEDAAWLRPSDDTAHINRSELEAVIKGLNLAIKWGQKMITVHTDSATVYHWLLGVVERTHNIRTRAMEELLIRRRLKIIEELMSQEGLILSVKLVKSRDNKADELTRIPSTWDMSLGSRASPSFQNIKEIHDRCHFGVDRSLQLAREKYPSVSKHLVKRVVSRCEACARIDPAPAFRHEKGDLQVARLWERWAVDVTHFQGTHYLTVVDAASGFTVWRVLRFESAKEVCLQLRQLMSELGPPDNLMSDNGAVFHSREFSNLMKDWGVHQMFASAYRSQGNATVERVHRTIKRSVMRSRLTVEESVFWLNNTRGLRAKSAFELAFGRPPRKPGLGMVPRDVVRDLVPNESTYDDLERNPFDVGDRVYMRSPGGRCDEPWSGPHVVTRLVSSVSVEVDDVSVPRHVSHLRLVPCQDGGYDEMRDDVGVELRDGANASNEEIDGVIPEASSAPGFEPRPERARRPPVWHDDYVVEVR